jgi:hypothetical protein
MASELQGNGEPSGSADPAGPPEQAHPDVNPPAGGTASKRSRSRRSYIMAGVAVVALLGGAGVALAVGGSGTQAHAAAAAASPTPSPTGGRLGFRHFGGLRRLGLGLGGGLFGAVHGQLVVPRAGGGYQTVDVQRGIVTAVSTASITVKSADGFSQSYAITGSTIVDAQRAGIGSVKVGDQAAVVATVSGSTATATSIIDRTLLRQSRQQFGFGGGAYGSPASQGT